MIQLPKEKLKALIIAGCISIALLVTGTFAWQSINQTAINQFEGEVIPGARLHDDFNGLQNKDIYVENYGSLGDGVPIYARIQLKEYMEIGIDAGNFEKQDRNVKVVGSTEEHKIEYNDVSTWHTHEFRPTSALDVEFRKYWDWELGNDKDTEEKYYMPTFNKNNQSLTSDVNGTLEGSDNDKTQGTPYDDYTVYSEGQTKDGKEEYYDPKNPTVPIQKDATHTAQKVEDKAKVISMQEWIALGKPIGEYWVYDRDGWAYYAKAIEAGKASGLLLNKVNAKKKPDDRYHYSIQAIGEFATAGDWSGFESITDEGRDLLDTITGLNVKAISIAPKDDKYHQTVRVGNSLTLEANVLVQNGSGNPSEKEVIWQMEDSSVNNMLTGNIFQPTDEKMAGKTYTIIMISKLTPEVSNKMQVTVLPASATSDDIVIGEDQKSYIYFGNNVYKRIEDDGSLSNYISAGNDKIIGNSDDLTNVVEINPSHDTFGNFFLKVEENLYKWMGEDGFLGTSDDKYVTSETNNWPDNITDFVADEIRIKTEEGISQDIKVSIGGQTKFIAEVYFKNQLMSDHEVTWSINGQGDASTAISEAGVLSVGANERLNTQINVIATSKQAPNKLRSSITVTVAQLGYNDIPSITPGSNTTVTMGNYEYYVLAKDDEKALVSVKNYFVKNSHIGTSGITVPWRDWTLRSYLNGDWLNAQPDEVKNNVIETTLYTRDDTYGVIETQDKVFLLNYEDFSEGNDPQLYTAGKPFSLDNFPDISSNLRGNTGRMPHNGSGSFANTKAILNGREITEEFLSHEKKIAPVFWIRLP